MPNFIELTQLVTSSDPVQVEVNVDMVETIRDDRNSPGEAILTFASGRTISVKGRASDLKARLQVAR